MELLLDTEPTPGTWDQPQGLSTGSALWPWPSLTWFQAKGNGTNQHSPDPAAPSPWAWNQPSRQEPTQQAQPQPSGHRTNPAPASALLSASSSTEPLHILAPALRLHRQGTKEPFFFLLGWVLVFEVWFWVCFFSLSMLNNFFFVCVVKKNLPGARASSGCSLLGPT